MGFSHKIFFMALPLPVPRAVITTSAVPDVFAQNAVTLVHQFMHEQQRRPIVLLIGYDPLLLQLLAPVEQLIICDVNAPNGTPYPYVTVLKQHSLRLGSGIQVDLVILNVFNSATLNRWAPVYIMRDLFRRRIVRTFGTRHYVYPTKGTMSLRLYEHPTGGTANQQTKITWQHGASLTNTDLLVPFSARLDVLYEQYDNPAQSWPTMLTFNTKKPQTHPVIAVLEWSLQLIPGVLYHYVASRSGRDVQHAQRLATTGMTYFAWPFGAVEMTLLNNPKMIGGVQLSTTTEHSGSEVSLTYYKMDSAIERWFGSIVAMQITL